MSSRSEYAAARFGEGFTCATSVLTAFCEDYDLDTDIASQLSCGLGGGCGLGGICGAASGAILVVGLKYGQYSSADKASKTNCKAHRGEFMERFKQAHNAVDCRDLLGLDIADEEAYAAAADRIKRVCTVLIKSAVEILEELGY